jgi:hypothetical protein
MFNPGVVNMNRAILILACLLIPGLCAAQNGELKLPSFAHLQKKAIDCVDLTIGAGPLHLASRFIGNDPEDAEAKEILKGLKAIRVRSYEFDSDFVYSKDDIDAIRSQLTEPGWSQLAHIRDQNKKEAVDVYLAYDHDKVVGLAIVSSDPRQFTVLNIVGSIDLEHLAQLEKRFNLPHSGADQILTHAALL